MNNKFKQNMIWNLIGSLTYVFSSMFFLMVVTRINGVDIAGEFSLSLGIANLFLCVANYATRIFHVTELKIADSTFYIHRVLTIMIMCVFAVIYSVVINASALANAILFLFIGYKILEAISEVNYAVLQKNNVIHHVGKSLLLKGILGFLVFTVVNIITKDIIISIVSLIIVTLLICIFYDIRMVFKCNISRESINIKNLIKIFIEGFAPCLFTFLSIYLMYAPRYALTGDVPESYQALFGILIMPSTIFIMASQFIAQPYLIKLKNNFKNYKNKEFNKIIRTVLKNVFILGIISLPILYFFGQPILEFMYGVELDNYKYLPVIFLIGGIFFGSSFVLSSGLTTRRKTKGQAFIYIITSICAIFISNYFVDKYSLLGSSYAYIVITFILCTLYIMYYLSALKK